MYLMLILFLVAIIAIIFLNGTTRISGNGYGTCWSGKSQDRLECCVGFSPDMNSEEMKNYYVKNGYTSENIGGSYWDCKDSSDPVTWWNNCNYYWNRNWTGSCAHDPEKWS
jgi:hypothetical protein